MIHASGKNRLKEFVKKYRTYKEMSFYLYLGDVMNEKYILEKSNPI